MWPTDGPDVEGATEKFSDTAGGVTGAPLSPMFSSTIFGSLGVSEREGPMVAHPMVQVYITTIASQLASVSKGNPIVNPGARYPSILDRDRGWSYNRQS